MFWRDMRASNARCLWSLFFKLIKLISLSPAQKPPATYIYISALSGGKRWTCWYLIFNIKVQVKAITLRRIPISSPWTHQYPHIRTFDMLQTAEEKVTLLTLTCFIVNYIINVSLYCLGPDWRKEWSLSVTWQNDFNLVILPYILKGSCLGTSTIHLKQQQKNDYRFCTMHMPKVNKL